MSELKSIHAYTFDEVEVINTHSNGNDYYLKSEVDKMIAELRWRNCAEEMPEEEAPVLFSDGKYIYKGCWTTWDGGYSDFSYETFSGWVEDGSEQDYEFNEIKYWKPLPKAPEDSK